jgi:hypothetical protein
MFPPGRVILQMYSCTSRVTPFFIFSGNREGDISSSERKTWNGVQ